MPAIDGEKKPRKLSAYLSGCSINRQCQFVTLAQIGRVDVSRGELSKTLETARARQAEHAAECLLIRPVDKFREKDLATPGPGCESFKQRYL